jgi:hypothetical protein
MYIINMTTKKGLKMINKFEHTTEYIAGLAILAGLGLSAYLLEVKTLESDKENRTPLVTKIAASETAGARNRLLAKFPLLAQQLKNMNLDTSNPDETTRLYWPTHTGDTGYKTVKLNDTFATSCLNLQAEWAKHLQTQFLGFTDEFANIDYLVRPLHNAEDRVASYTAGNGVTTFTLSRHDKGRESNYSYSLTLSCN